MLKIAEGTAESAPALFAAAAAAFLLGIAAGRLSRKPEKVKIRLFADAGGRISTADKADKRKGTGMA